MNKTQINLIFSIFGESFFPQKLTNVIFIAPTSSWIKGELVRGTKREIIRHDSCWIYETGFIETLVFEDISDIYIKVFERNVEVLREYISMNKLEAKIDIVVEIFDEQTPALVFNRKFLTLTNKIEAEIDVDIYLLSSS